MAEFPDSSFCPRLKLSLCLDLYHPCPPAWIAQISRLLNPFYSIISCNLFKSCRLCVRKHLFESLIRSRIRKLGAASPIKKKKKKNLESCFLLEDDSEVVRRSISTTRFYNCGIRTRAVPVKRRARFRGKFFASPVKTRTGRGSSRPIYSRARFKSSFTPASYKPPPSVEAAEVCLSIVLGFTSTSHQG